MFFEYLSLTENGSLILMKSNLSIFSFTVFPYAVIFMSCIRNLSLPQHYEDIFLCYRLKSFIILLFTFRFIVFVEVDFCQSAKLQRLCSSGEFSGLHGLHSSTSTCTFFP